MDTLLVFDLTKQVRYLPIYPPWLSITMTQQTATQQQVHVLPHSYSPSYQPHVASGVACNRLANDRVELSFYADRARYMHEELELVPGQVGQFQIKEGVGIASSPVREHMTAVNMSLEELKAFYDMLTLVLNEPRK